MLPYLQEVQNASKKYVVSFRGLNYGEGTQDGEFSETYNLSTDQYPCITQRAERVGVNNYTNPSTLHAKGKLLVIAEQADNKEVSDVYYGDTIVGQIPSGKKQTATIGNYIVIFPDKMYYKVPTDDDKDGEYGSLEAVFTKSKLSFTNSTISLKNELTASWLDFTTSEIKMGKAFKVQGVKFEQNSISKTGANFPFKDGDAITITGCSYSSNNKTTEVIIQSATSEKLTFASNIFSARTDSNTITITREKAEGQFAFKDGDTITISGCSKSENNKELAVTKATSDTLTFADNSFSEATEVGSIKLTRKGEGEFPFKEGDAVTIEGCSKNENNKKEEILIRGVSENKDVLTFDDNAFTAVTDEDNEVTIKRGVPDLDFVCESNYRLWGTHGNTIYSSKFSDPFNFKVFDGLANDSYAIEVGSEGEFTGCIPYSSHICFFKENTLHKLYGTKPSNFQVTTVNVYGVQSGSEKSMQIVNEQLLYKGVGGVYAYTGGVPELISENFGNKRYCDAVACCDGEKYYISMKQGETWHMFTYDVLKNIWLREDDTQAVDMAFFNGYVYYLDAKGGLYYIDKTADRNGIEWGATFCTFHETMNERKGYSKFHLRMDMSAGAWIAVDIKTDNDLQWKQIYTTHNEKAKTVSIPIIPTRCDSIDIRLRGKGKCTVKTFIREFTAGSDV